MAYTALYRKFRPKTFNEMVGQEHITTTLKNQIMANRVGHAYLFNGGRGTGKTSAAKILARAINCLNPKDGEPCNECEICKGILSGSLTDVVEMDAASNNSVEDIRTIREEVNFLPTLAKYRVYIIDEVHMLSTGAFNALLKTLEEPPEHVKFILATTEPQKLPATILSRCQRFDFKRISNSDIIKRLKIVCKESNIEITEGALNIIASLSEGAMRDALSILERTVQEGTQNIDEDTIKEMVGIPKLVYINNIVTNIVNYDVENLINNIKIVLDEGKDINNFIWEIIKYIKDILVFKSTKKLSLYSEDEINQISEISNKVSKERLLQLIYDISELENTIKLSTQKLILFETGLIKLCNQEHGNINSDLEKRVAFLEDKLNCANVSISNKAGVRYIENPDKSVTSNVINQTANKVAIESKVTKVKQGTIASEWPNIVNEFKINGKIMLYTNLINTKAVEISDLTVGIEFPNGITSFGKTVLEKSENKNEIIKQISMVAGKEMNVKYIDNKSNLTQNKSNNTLEDMMTNLDIPFNVVE